MDSLMADQRVSRTDQSSESRLAVRMVRQSAAKKAEKTAGMMVSPMAQKSEQSSVVATAPQKGARTAVKRELRMVCC